VAELTSTPLREQLAGVRDERKPGPLDALLAARRRFQSGERIDRTALATELGVNRVTLYRWVGSREQLLVEVIWSLAARTLAGIDADVPRSGGPQLPGPHRGRAPGGRPRAADLRAACPLVPEEDPDP
jgi:hypothetical protein